MRTALLFICLTTGALFLAGCAFGEKSGGTIDGGTTVYPEANEQIYLAILPSCIYSSDSNAQAAEIAPLAGSILLALGNTLIPAGTTYILDKVIERAGQATLRSTASSTAVSDSATHDKLYEIGSSEKPKLSAGCILIARRAIGDIRQDFKDRVDSRLAYSDIARKELNQLLPGLNLRESEYPGFLLEFRLEPISAYNDNGQAKNVAVRIRPTTLVYLESGADRISKNQEKDVVISLSLEGFLPDSEGKLSQRSIYRHDFTFDNLNIGTVENYDSLESEQAPADLKPRLIGKSGPIVPIPLPYFTIGNDIWKLEVPLKATVVMTELEERGDLARAIIAAAEKNKGDIKSPIDSKLKEILTDTLGRTR